MEKFDAMLVLIERFFFQSWVPRKAVWLIYIMTESVERDTLKMTTFVLIKMQINMHTLAFLNVVSYI